MTQPSHRNFYFVAVHNVLPKELNGPRGELVLSSTVCIKAVFSDSLIFTKGYLYIGEF